MKAGVRNLEDFGYRCEEIVLLADHLGLGTCWLGGMFTKSSFAKRIGLAPDEEMPAVAAIGFPAEGSREKDWIRRHARSDQRLPWETLFFDGRFGNPLPAAEAGAWAQPLEMVRLAPSASNKQPWRVVRQDGAWHFYLERTPRYGKGTLIFRLLRLSDLQRVDMGIAMCHFELAARELGLEGRWAVADPGLRKPSDRFEYTVSWIP